MINNTSNKAGNSNVFHESDFDFPNFEEFTSSFNSSQNDDNNSSNCTDSGFNPFSNIDMNTILKMKQVIDGINNNKNNPRSNLLLSLKPYLRPERRAKVDTYIQLFNMGSIMENFKSNSGGEDK